jgi:predicted PurR-regulated permease PerM
MMMMDDWRWMTGFSLAHLLVFAVMVTIVLYPLGRILRRIGVSPFWSVLVFIPLVNLIGLWVLAFASWPARKSEVGA